MFPKVSLKDLKHPWNWTLALISSFYCLKYSFMLKVLETWLGMLLFPLYFYLYYMDTRSLYRVWPGGHMSKTNVPLQRNVCNEWKQIKSQLEIKLVWMQFETMYCKLDFLLQTHLMLPCNVNIWKYWQHEIIILKRPLFKYILIMSLLSTALREKHVSEELHVFQIWKNSKHPGCSFVRNVVLFKRNDWKSENNNSTSEVFYS